MIVIIDNYDSFTFNLFQYVSQFHSNVVVLKNDDPEIFNLKTNIIDAFILSPGPGTPNDGGFMLDLIQKYYSQIPFLGICLGHQAIIQLLGGKIISAKEVCHGKVHNITHNSKSIIFKNIDTSFKATRYHSLVVCKKNLPKDIEVTAIDQSDGEIMAIQHKNKLIFGLQFHPESIETKHGLLMIKNFIDVIKK
mgnify:FL=1